MALSAKEIRETTRWQDLTEGLSIYEPATSKGFLTGEWRIPRLWNGRNAGSVCFAYRIARTVPSRCWTGSVWILITITVRAAESAWRPAHSGRFQ